MDRPIAPRPALLQLGTGPLAFRAYKAEFNRLYRTAPIVDVLGRTVIFNGDSASHVCFKPKGEDPYFRKPRTEWVQERADRIAYIGRALVDPWEIRPNHHVPERRLGYLLRFPAEGGLLEEFYYVAVDQGDGDDGTVQFLTGFPLVDRQGRQYWNDARRGGRCLYPPEKAEKSKGK